MKTQKRIMNTLSLLVGLTILVILGMTSIIPYNNFFYVISVFSYSLLGGWYIVDVHEVITSSKTATRFDYQPSKSRLLFYEFTIVLFVVPVLFSSYIAFAMFMSLLGFH